MLYLLQVYTWALEIVEIYMFTFSIQVDSIIYAIIYKELFTMFVSQSTQDR